MTLVSIQAYQIQSIFIFSQELYKYQALIFIFLITSITALYHVNDLIDYSIYLELYTFAIVLILANIIESSENFYSAFLSYNLVSSFSLIALFTGIMCTYANSNVIIDNITFFYTMPLVTQSTKLGIGVFTFYTYRIYANLPFKAALIHLTVTKQGYFLALLVLLEFMKVDFDIIITLIITSILSSIFIFLINQEFIATLTASSLTQFTIALLPLYNFNYNNSIDILSIYYVALLIQTSIQVKDFYHKKSRLINFDIIFQKQNSNFLLIIISLIIFTSLAGVPPTIGIFSKILGLMSISNSPVLSVVFILSTIFPIYFYLYQFKLITYSSTGIIKNYKNNLIFLMTILYCLFGTIHQVFNITNILL